MSGSDTSVKFALSKDHDGYFKSAFAKDLVSNSKPNIMYNSSVSLLNSDELDIVSESEDVHLQFGIQKTTANVHSFLWQNQLQSDCRTLLEDNRRSLGLARLPQGEELGGRLHTSILQSEVESLRWRLKESEESRLIYRRSVQELVRFLERAHARMGSLAAHLAGGGTSATNTSNAPGDSPPSASSSPPDRRNSDVFPRKTNENDQQASPQHRDFTWRRPRRAVSVPRELDPARIADEALRLHRLATSLLQTGAPWLTDTLSQHDPHDAIDGSVDQSPLNTSTRQQQLIHHQLSNQQQLPAICCGTSTPERRQSSSSSSSSLGSSVTANGASNGGITSAFSRVGSLQKSTLSSEDSTSTTSKEGDCRLVRASISIPATKKDFRRGGVGKLARDIASTEASSSSTENESGFSSMNSFHEIGLPLINSTMMSSKSSCSSSDDSRTMIQHDDSTLKRKSTNLDKSLHQRWDSTPVNSVLYDKTNERVTLKSDDIRVLWV